MAIGVAEEGSITTVEASSKNYTVPLMLMVSLYFGIGFITALNDILVPHFKDLFHLNNVTALLVQFCFFGAYFVMSLPSGWIVGRIGYKSGIVVALSVMGRRSSSLPTRFGDHLLSALPLRALRRWKRPSASPGGDQPLCGCARVT